MRRQFHVVEAELEFGFRVGIRSQHLDQQHAASLRQIEDSQRHWPSRGNVRAVEIGLRQNDLALERDLDDPVGSTVKKRSQQFVAIRRRYVDGERDPGSDLAFLPDQSAVPAGDSVRDHLLRRAPERQLHDLKVLRLDRAFDSFLRARSVLPESQHPFGRVKPEARLAGQVPERFLAMERPVLSQDAGD